MADVRFGSKADMCIAYSGSYVRRPAFMPGDKDMGKWSRFSFHNHPIVTNGPRCRYLRSDKTGAYARHHVTANHVATTQDPDEAARLSCKVRSPWLASDKELRPSCRQAKQASQMLGSEMMQETICCDDIHARLHRPGGTRTHLPESFGYSNAVRQSCCGPERSQYPADRLTLLSRLAISVPAFGQRAA